VEADHRRVLEEHVLEGRELRVERTAGLAGELAQRVLETPLQELRELGSEPQIPARVGDRGEAQALVVPLLQFGEPTGEAGAEVEDEDPEEGDGLNLALALDEPGLSSELLDGLRRKEAGERLLHLATFEGDRLHRTRGTPRHPIEVTEAG
jgi:hypothetical protein